jgi:RHS repeat-associated protein
VTSKNVYGTFGETSALAGTTFGFTGQRYDSDTGLYYYKNRYYSPTIGRFLQPDPAGYTDGLNLYIYAGNNAVMFADPLGLASTSAGSTLPYGGVVSEAVPDPLVDQILITPFLGLGRALLYGIGRTITTIFSRAFILEEIGSSGVTRLTGQLLGMSSGSSLSGSFVMANQTTAMVEVYTIAGNPGAIEQAVQGIVALARQQGATTLVVKAWSPRPGIARLLTSQFGGVVQNGNVIIVSHI